MENSFQNKFKKMDVIRIEHILNDYKINYNLIEYLNVVNNKCRRIKI